MYEGTYRKRKRRKREREKLGYAERMKFEDHKDGEILHLLEYLQM
jgi:hypothetical protein